MLSIHYQTYNGMEFFIIQGSCSQALIPKAKICSTILPGIWDLGLGIWNLELGI
jgi:hypothetical protein